MSLHAIAPRLARARDALLAERERQRAHRRRQRERETQLERLVAHKLARHRKAT